MVRLLFIGRFADRWITRVSRLVGDGADFDSARLPSAGVRQFEQTPSDLVVVADEDADRVADIAEAVRQRPLGRLVPLLVVGPRPDDAESRRERLELLDWLDDQTPPDRLVDVVEAALETELRAPSADSDQPPTSTKTDADSPAPVPPDDATAGAETDEAASYFGGDVVLEPVDDGRNPRRIDRQSVFEGADSRLEDGDEPVDADEIERKLEAVRHEDYYAVLELGRGADTRAVREAFHRLYERFDPDRLDFQLLRAHRDAVDEIRDALEDAFAVLGDPELREAYREYTVR